MSRLSGNWIKKHPYLMYTLLFSVVALIGFSYFIIQHKGLCNNGDAFDQNIPLMINIKHILTGLLHGDKPDSWAWNIGLGADSWGNMIGVFFDPFAYIAFFLPEKYLGYSYTLSIVAKMWAAGLAIMCFLRYRKIEEGKVVIGGLSYAFCLWALESIQQMAFFKHMILFPLIMLGIEKVNKERKPLILIISVGYSFILSSYFSVMSGIMCAVYVVVNYFIFPEKKDIKENLGKFISMFLSVILALLISAAAIIPGIYTLTNSNTGVRTSMQILFPTRIMARFLPIFLSGGNYIKNYSNITVGGIFIVLMCVGFCSFVKNKKVRVPVTMLIISIVFLFFPVFDRMFNGFSYPVGRWCYAFEFFFVWSGIEVWEACVEEATDKQKKVYGIVSLTVTAILGLSFIPMLMLNEGVEMNEYLVGGTSFVFAIVFAVLFFWGEKIFKKPVVTPVILLTVVINLCLQVFFAHFPGTTRYNQYVDINVPYTYYNQSLLKSAKQIADDDFYRVDQFEHVSAKTTAVYNHAFPARPNEGVYFGVPSVSSYFSTLDTGWADFNRTLMNNYGYSLRVHFMGNDNRAIMDYLLGVKYYLKKDMNNEATPRYGYGDDSMYGDVAISSSMHNPGLGYVYENVISTEDYMSFPELQRQQVLMQAAVVDDYNGDAEYITPEDVSITAYEIPLQIVQQFNAFYSGNSITVASKNSYIAVNIPEIENSEIYVQLNGLIYKGAISNEKQKYSMGEALGIDTHNFTIVCDYNGANKTLKNLSDLNSGSIDDNDYMCNMGYYDQTSGTLRINFKSLGLYEVDSIKIYAMPIDVFEENAQKMDSARFTVTSYGDDVVDGFVDSNGGLLYMSVVNCGGWDIYVDGEKADIIQTNIGFIGVNVTPGKHDIHMEYSTVAIKQGVCITLVGLVLSAGYVLLERKRQSVKSAV